MGGETATVPVFDLLSARAAPAVVRWVGTDSAVVTYGELEVHATVTEVGDLLEYTVPAAGIHAVRIEGAHPLMGPVSVRLCRSRLGAADGSHARSVTVVCQSDARSPRATSVSIYIDIVGE